LYGELYFWPLGAPGHSTIFLQSVSSMLFCGGAKLV